MFGIGMTELMVLFVVGLVVLGPKRLPSLARSLGRTLAEFRHASNDLRRDFLDVTNSIDVNETDPPNTSDEASAPKSVPSAAPNPLPSPLKDPSASAPAKGPAAKDPSNEKGPETSGG